MKIGKFGLAWIFLLTAAFVFKVSPVHAPNGYPSELTETVMTNVNCTIAKVNIFSMVTSQNTTLVHFPSGVDMNDLDLENAVTLGLMFFSAPAQSFLVYQFENIDEATAKTIADGFTPSINTAFQTSFTWHSTGTSNSYVNVTYTEPGKANLVAYVNWLMDQCLASDLGGFTLTFIPMVQAGAFFSVAAQKSSGGFEWNYIAGAGRTVDIPTGSNSHTINFLQLLNVGSLEPSPYSATDGGFSSMVVLLISSDQTVNYVRCEPGLASSPEQRGWILSPLPPSNTLMAYFSFGGDSSPVAPLTFTFSGVVVPEFTTLAPIVLLMLVTAAVFLVKRRFQKI